MKKYIVVVFLLLVIAFVFIQVNLFYSKETLYIKDFEKVVEDYSKIRDILFKHYNKENYSEMLILDIDKSNFEIIDGDKKINMNDEEKNSLKKICETSYKVHYNFIWVTENYIIFWEDETKLYGVIYSKEFKESIEEIKKWYDGVQFRRIEGDWYEIGYFGI